MAELAFGLASILKKEISPQIHAGLNLQPLLTVTTASD